MKKTCLFLLALLLTLSLQAQLFEGGLKRKEKTEKEEKPAKPEKEKEEKEEKEGKSGDKKSFKEMLPIGDNKIDITKNFKYKCFTLGESNELTEIMACLQGNKFITEMDYYEQGENIRFIERGATVTLMFDDLLTKKITQLDIEDIEELSFVQQLQNSVLQQLGNPDMGYEIMKNYDGSESSVWSDYSTYEFVYRYMTATNIYDFRITQFGAKTKNGRVLHPYTFSATVTPRTQVTKTEEGSKVENNFYPELGVKNIDGYTIETQILRKW